MNNFVEELTKDIDKRMEAFENENKEPTTIEELTYQIDKQIQKLEEEKKIMIRIEISNRHYNGDFGVGSIFEEKYSFEIEENLCYSNSIKSFCNNEYLGGNVLSNVYVSIPFILNKNDIQKLSNITNNIQNNSNYLYNESHYKKDSFDFKRYKYIDISINETNYELSIEEDKDLINEIKNLFKINKIDEILNNSINEIISMESNHD